MENNLVETMDSVKLIELYEYAAAVNFPDMLPKIQDRLDQLFNQRDDNSEPTPFYSKVFANHAEAEQVISEIKTDMPELAQFVEENQGPLTSNQREFIQAAMNTTYQDIREGKSAPDVAVGTFRQEDIEKIKTHSTVEVIAFNFYPDAPADRNEMAKLDNTIPQDIVDLFKDHGFSEGDAYAFVRDHAAAYIAVEIIKENEPGLIANAEKDRMEAEAKTNSFAEAMKGIAEACAEFQQNLKKTFYKGAE